MAPWKSPGAVAGFVHSAPNAQLLRVAGDELTRHATRRLVDIGCGAGRNALPLARLGWDVVGTDLSEPMLRAARDRCDTAPGHAHFVLAPMDCLPVATDSTDFLVAHGIWNLARSSAEFRAALREASRIARAGAGLFVFTFSRATLPPDTQPVDGESFVFTQFSGQRQCFLTADQLVSELADAGFLLDGRESLRELNRRPPRALPGPATPVIYEGVWRRVSTA